MTSRCWARSTAPWPTWKTRPAAGPRPCASRRSPWATSTRPASPRTAPSATTTWPTTWSARAPTRPRSWPTAWRRPPSACRRSPAYCPPRCATWRIPTCPPPRPPSPTWLKRVEAIEGVRFQALFERLPRTAPDGDAAIAAVWQMVADEKRRRDEDKQRQDAVLAAAPAAVRAAFELEGDEFNAALRAALAETARGGSRRPDAAPAGSRSDPRLSRAGHDAGAAQVRAAAARHRRRGERRGTTRPDRAGTRRPGSRRAGG